MGRFLTAIFEGFLIPIRNYSQDVFSFYLAEVCLLMNEQKRGFSKVCPWTLVLFLCGHFLFAAAYHDPKTQIAGRVFDDEGIPIPGVNILLETVDQQKPIASTTSNKVGRFVFQGLPGRFQLTIEQTGFAPYRQIIKLPLKKQPLEIRLASEYKISHLSQTFKVYSANPRSAASSSLFREAELRRIPVETPGDVLRVIPGMVVAQHGGGGKADQYLIRGFDADHGTDFALFFEGVPVNMVSHAHGQGYADLSFIIPETLRQVDVYKGFLFHRIRQLGNRRYGPTAPSRPF